MVLRLRKGQKRAVMFNIRKDFAKYDEPRGIQG